MQDDVIYPGRLGYVLYGCVGNAYEPRIKGRLVASDYTKTILCAPQKLAGVERNRPTQLTPPSEPQRLQD